MKKFTLIVLALFTYGAMAGQNPQARNANWHSKSGNQNHSIKPMQKGGVSISPASTIFTDNMNGLNEIVDLNGRGYTTYFRGTGIPGQSPEWFQGIPAPSALDAYNGPGDGYVASDFSTVDATNDIDNWLVLPVLSVATGDSFTFYCTALPFPGGYVDSVRVMYNATGATLPEDLNWVELGRFLVDTNGVWERKGYEIPATSATGVLAIRYCVANGGPTGPNSDYIGIDQLDVFDAAAVVYTIDNCLGAVDISSQFGQPVGIEQVSGPYDNTTATTDASEPNYGFECWGEPDGGGAAPELNKSLWFTFTGDGNNYFVETGTCAGVTNYIDDGDTQFALYTGPCNQLVAYKCNEDGPSATTSTYPAGFSFSTVVGETYYLMVDGFSLQGAISTGEFCMKVTQQATITCSDLSLTTGTEAQNASVICFNDSIIVTTTGAISPNVGDYFGLSWVISTGDVSGLPIASATSIIRVYTFVSPAPAVSTLRFANNAANRTAFSLTTDTILYWTPVIFGNAVAATIPPLYLNDLTLDPTCTFLGNSLMVNLLNPGSPACIIGINEQAKEYYGISSIYPVPANNDVKIVLNAKENASLDFKVRDYLGREVISKQIEVLMGENNLSLDLSSQASGVYIIQVTGNKGSYNVKFVKE